MNKKQQVKRLIPSLKPYSRDFALAFVAILINSIGVLGIGNGLKLFIDSGLKAKDLEALNHYFLYLALCVIVIGSASYFRVYLSAKATENWVAGLRTKLYAKILELPPSYYETRGSGEIVSRVVTDTTLLQTLLVTSFPHAVRNIILLVGGISLLVLTSKAMAGYMLLVIPLVVIPIVLLARKVRKLSRTLQDSVGEISRNTEDSVSGIETIQAFVAESSESAKFGKLVDTSRKYGLAKARRRAALAGLVITLILIAIISVLWVGARQVIGESLTGGELSSFIFFAVVVASSAGSLSELGAELNRAAGASERLFEVLEAEVEIQSTVTALPAPLCVDSISLRNLGFAYSVRPDYMVLDGVNLTITKGESVALVGASGSGKTTIIKLLERFIDPTTGEILVNGVNLKELELKSWRQKIGLVAQNPFIFSGTVRDNLKIGRSQSADDRCDDDLMSALESASLVEFVESLPNALDTYIGEKGIMLSGGQKQRLAIARVFVNNPEILLLDEATSSLDAENEAHVQKAMESLMKGRTSVVIAHRLATVQRSNRILVLDQGKISASGTHAELIKSSDLYKGLAKLQFIS
jgi:ATP-binding cassette subfamily B protein